MKSAPSDDENDPASKSEGEQLVSSLLEYNPVTLLLQLYFHRTVIDLALLATGVVYLMRVVPARDMRPVYLTIRGGLGLLSTPFSIMAYLQETESVKFLALKMTGLVLDLVGFGWLIYGTFLVASKTSDQGGCDGICFWVAACSVMTDWTWATAVLLVTLCPFCWALSDQWMTLLFLIFVAVRNSRRQKNGPQLPQ